MIINFHIETHPKIYKGLHCISLVFLLRVLLLRVINMVLSVLLISLVLHVTIADSFLDNLRYMYDVNENSRNSDVSGAMPGNKNLGDSGNAAPPLGVVGESPGLQRRHIPHLDGEQETSPRMQLDLNNLMKEKIPTKETFKPNVSIYYNK